VNGSEQSTLIFWFLCILTKLRNCHRRILHIQSFLQQILPKIHGVPVCYSSKVLLQISSDFGISIKLSTDN